MGSARVLPPGEPILAKAILQASKLSGAGYVHRHEGVEGWHVHDSIPRGVSVYYRVSAQRIYVRTADRIEYFFGTVENGVIVQKAEAPR